MASIAAHGDAGRRGPALAAAAQGTGRRRHVAELPATSERYESDLAARLVTTTQPAASPADYKRRIGRSALTAALTAPLAAIGVVIHFVPYQIMKQVGKRPSEGMRATVKLLGCTALFTAVYSAIGIRAGRRRGLLAGVAGFLLGPISGYVTVRWARHGPPKRSGPARRDGRAGDAWATWPPAAPRSSPERRPSPARRGRPSQPLADLDPHPLEQVGRQHRAAVASAGHPPQRLRLARPGEQRLGVFGTEHPLVRVVRDDDEAGAMAATALRRSAGSPAAGSTLVPERPRMRARPRRVAVQRARRTPAGRVRSRQAGAETAITPANGLPAPAANSAEAPPRLIPRPTTGSAGASARPAATAAATSAGSATPNVLRPPERPCPRKSRATTWAHVDSWSTAAWISQLRDQFEKPCTTTTVAIASAGPGTHTADRRVPSADRSRSASAGGR